MKEATLRGLTIVDAEGRVVMRLGTDSIGEPVIALIGSGGHTRVAMSIRTQDTDEVAVVSLHDAEGHIRAHYGVAADGSERLVNVDGRPRKRRMPE